MLTTQELQQFLRDFELAYREHRERVESRYWRWFGQRRLAYQLRCPTGATL